MNGEQSGPPLDEQSAESRTSPGLSNDRLYRALSSTRRRRLLYLLLQEGESTIDRIATVLTGWETTETGGMATPNDYERLAVGLVHVHLPQLEEMGFVEYDREEETARIEPVDDEVADLIHRSVAAGRHSGP